MKTGILKNLKRFYNLKLAEGICLNSASTTKRKEYNKFGGVSINRYGNIWFKLVKGDALFKTYSDDYKYEERKIRIVNEMICCILANQVGIKHAEYEPAHLKSETGLITYNFLQDGQELKTLAEFLMIDQELDNNLVDVAEAINQYKDRLYIIDKEQMLLDLYKIIVFDALTLQTDRHASNINFIFNGPKVSVAPLFDNEYAFACELFDSSNHTIDKVIDEYSKEAKILTIENEIFSIKKYKNNIKNICDLAKSNSEMNCFLRLCLNNINVGQAFIDLESAGFNVNPEYKEYVCGLVNHTKSLICEELKKAPNGGTCYLYDEYLK